MLVATAVITIAVNTSLLVYVGSTDVNPKKQELWK